MTLFPSRPGRRRFLISFIASAISLIFSRAVNAFSFLFQRSETKALEKTGSEKISIKGIVVYHSSMGITAKTANAIYKGIKSVIPCDVAPVQRIDPKEIVKYDLVDIGAKLLSSGAG